MYISKIEIENFRLFGSGEQAFTLTLNPGLNALIGENDAGKTAVIDAVRLVLGTRDQESLRIDVTDFHQQSDGSRAEQIYIKLQFLGLTPADRAAFAEFLTYEEINGSVQVTLIITCVAKRNTKEGTSRRMLPLEWRTGINGDGPLLDFGARSLLTTTYLRPLRDAERSMSAGRGSRLSQILQHTREIRSTGQEFDESGNTTPNPIDLSLLGLCDYTNYLFGRNEGVQLTQERLNNDYLKPLSFANNSLIAHIGINSANDDALRLRQLLEKFELVLKDNSNVNNTHCSGLGSNNLLFMACELLLLATESDGFPLLLIEEPEAHLHPQRQLRLMSFLKEQAEIVRTDEQRIQILVTTHSPNLASYLKLDNLILIKDGRSFSLNKTHTMLDPSDYRFLERFLDVTKANLFFARSVLIVEGDAENILLPVIAKLLGRDFHLYGTSIVNVGGTGLGRYARIFMRRNLGQDGMLNIPVACVTDMDVMPDCAPWIVGKLNKGEQIPDISQSKRRWRVKQDFPGNKLDERRNNIKEKASGQRVETFVANQWTLEFDLAYYGLAKEVFIAAMLALNDEKINTDKIHPQKVILRVRSELKKIDLESDFSVKASQIYAKFEIKEASKSIAAQYLAEILEFLFKTERMTAEKLQKSLPPYVVKAIEHVTKPFPNESTQEEVILNKEA